MARLLTYQTDFASGEIDPTMIGQTALKAYAHGAKRVRNCQRMATGGLERRWGTFDLSDIGADARLCSFEFSDTQRYVIAIYAGGLKVFDLNGVLLVTLAGQPWTRDQAFQLGFSQRGDTFVISHTAFWPRLLKRTGPTTFTIGLFVFDVSIDGNRIWQPYYKFSDAAVSLSCSASTGAITVTSSAALFNASHVGQRFRIYDAEIQVSAFTDSTHVNATVQGELKGSLDLDPFKTTKGSTKVEVLHLFHGLQTGGSITLSGGNTTGDVPGAEFDGAFTVTVLDELRYQIDLTPVSFQIREDANLDGTLEVNTYTSARVSEDGGGPNVKFSVAGTATRTWGEPAFSSLRGYPGGSSFHEGRLWFGGTPSEPDGCFGSRSLLPFNFDIGKGYDGDAVQVAAGTEDVSRVKYLISNGELQLFTAVRESIFITRDGEPITPNNARIKGQSSAGCADVQPIIFDGATLFIQENGLSISEFVYSNNDGGYIPTPVSTLAGHLVRKPVAMDASLGTTARSEQQAFFANSDGTLAVFHSMRKENIAGWGLWTLGAGEIKSVCAVGPYVFFCVFVRGAYRLYRLAEGGLNSLDGQVAHVSGVAKTHWTLDARLRGRDVSIVSELGYHGIVSVPADGVIDLSVPVLNVVGGDSYFWEIQLLPPVVQLPNGEHSGLIKRIVRSVLLLDTCYSVTVNGVPIVTRFAGDDFSAAPRSLTGPYEMRHLGFARNGTLTISQTEPLPGRILSVTQEVKI